MGALPRHPKKERKLPNAERNVALTLWVFTIPAGWQAIRFMRRQP